MSKGTTKHRGREKQNQTIEIKGVGISIKPQATVKGNLEGQRKRESIISKRIIYPTP